MKKNLNKLMALMLVIAMVLSLAACTSNATTATTPETETTAAESTDAAETQETDDTAAKAGTAVYVGRALSDPYCAKLANEFQTMMAENYPDWDIMILDSENDAEKEATNYETILTTLEPGDFVLTTALSGSDAKPYMVKMTEAGIINVSINVSADGVVAAAVAKDYDMGYLVGSYVRDNAPEGTKIAMMNGDSGYQLSFERRDGMMAAIAERDDLEIIVEQDCKFDKTTGMKTMEDWLLLYGDEIGAVIGGNDGMILGAIEAYKSGGYSLDGKIFVGLDGLADACASIEAGEETASVLQDAHAMIELGIDLAMRQINGEEVEQTDYYTDSVVITRDNVADYK